MNDKINSKEEKEKQNTIILLLKYLFSVVIIVLVYGIILYSLGDKYLIENYFFSPPWLIAGGTTATSAIDQFCGQSIDKTVGESKYLLLHSILFYFVLGPTLFFFYLRKAKLRNEQLTGFIKHFHFENAFLLLGLIIIIPFLFTVLMGNTITPNRFDESKASTGFSQISDSLHFDAAKVSFALLEYAALPEELGGGDGTFNKTYEDDSVSTLIQLGDLKKLKLALKNDFLLKYTSDTLVTVYGISKKSACDTTYKNINGDRGNIQVHTILSVNKIIESGIDNQ